MAWQDFFLTEVLFFPQAWLNGIFFLMEVKSQPDPLIVGVSDIGHRHYGPENRWSGPGIKPWTHKKIMLQGQGIKPWTNKKDHVQSQGFELWTDRKNRSYDRARDR